MRRLLKIFLALLVVFAVSQTPFAYRRYQFSQLDATLRRLDSERAATDGAGYADYRGVLHVHTFLGGHSPGTPEEVLAGARANRLAFVVMSEHPSAQFDTRALTLSGQREGVLFVAGSETSEDSRDRLLTFGGARASATTRALPGRPAPPPAETAPPPSKPAPSPDSAASPAAPPAGAGLPAPPTQALIDRAKSAGDLVFVAHPETFTGWQTASNFDGMEVYNLHADAKNARPLSLFFDGLWSYRAYPHLLWTRFHRAPAENLKRWDELTAGGRRVVAVAGNDAHANVGLSLQELSGRPFFRIRLDPYERTFRVVRTHALVPAGVAFDEASLLDALARGHAYVSFDLLCDADGFRFTATGGGQQKIMGDEITLGAGGEVRLRAGVPVVSRVVLIRDGRVVGEKEGRTAEWAVAERGVYRVECYLPQLPEPLSRQPWIISNPIYVR